MLGFFFSSRRRHTRSLCDWSSDVCSSDLLVGGRRKSLSILGGVTDPQPRAIGDFEGSALQEFGGRSELFSFFINAMKSLDQQGGGQLLASLTVSTGAFIHVALAVQGKKGLHVANDFATGSVALEHLPDPAPEGASPSENALAAMITGRGFKENLSFQSRAETFFDLKQSQWSQATGEGFGPAAHGSQTGTQSGKEGCFHRAVSIPPY